MTLQEALLYAATWGLIFMVQLSKAVKDKYIEPMVGSLVTASIWTGVLFAANVLTDFVRWIHEDEQK